MSGAGFTDWQDLGVFPAQDHDSGVPIEIRQTLVAGRVGKLEDTDSSDPDAGITQYAKDDNGMGTLGDVHPWLFWQTKDRGGRGMGAWSMAWAAMTTGGGQGGRAAVITRGGSRLAAGGSVNPNLRGGSRTQKASASSVLPIANADGASDQRFTPKTPGWPKCFPTVPQGVQMIVMPATEEGSQQEVMLHADPRLFAVNTSSPASHGSIVVDLQPNGIPCMDGAEPGMGGRHARLQSMMRVVVMPKKLPGIPIDKGNAIGFQMAESGQDSLAGFGLMVGKGDDRPPPRSQPTTGSGRPDKPPPVTTGDKAPSEGAGEGGARGGGQGDGGATDGGEAPNDSGTEGLEGVDGPAGSTDGAAGEGATDTPGPTASGAVYDPNTGTWRGPRRHVRNDPFVGRGGSGFRPGGAGIVGRGTQGGGGGATPCDYGKFKKKNTKRTNAFLAMASAFGPIHMGHENDDKHKHGKDKDGHAINSAHISTDALYYMDQDKDGPLWFEGMDYPKPNPLPGVSRVHLSWDKTDEHAWTSGSKEGKWKWFAEVPYAGGGGDPPPRIPGDITPPPTDTPKDPTTPSPTTPTTPTTPDATTPNPTTPSPTTDEPSAGGTEGGPTTPPTGGGSDALPPGWTRAGDGGAIDPQGHWHSGPPSRDATGGNDDSGETSGGSPGEPGYGGDGEVRPEGEQGDLPRDGPQGDGDYYDDDGYGFPSPGTGDDDTPGGDPIPTPAGCARRAPGNTTPTTPDNATGGAGGGGAGGAGGHGANNTGHSTGASSTGGTDSFSDNSLGGYVTQSPKGAPRHSGIQHTVGDVSDEDVGLYDIFHPMQESFTQLAFRPELLITGYPSLIHNPEAGPHFIDGEGFTRPQVMLQTVFGNQGVDGDWAHEDGERAQESRARGGISMGGTVFMPPQFTLQDYYGINSGLDVYTYGIDASSIPKHHLGIAPGVGFTFGVPTATGRMADTAVIFRQDVADANHGLLIAQQQSGGNLIELMRMVMDQGSGEVAAWFEGAQFLGIPTGTTAEQPAVLVPTPGSIRWNTDTPGLEVWDGGAWTAVGGGGGGGNPLLDGVVHTDTVPGAAAPTPQASVIGDDGAGNWQALSSGGGLDMELVAQMAGGGPTAFYPLGRNNPGTDDLVPVGTCVVAAGAPGPGWTAGGAVSGPMNVWAAGLGAPFSFFEKL